MSTQRAKKRRCLSPVGCGPMVESWNKHHAIGTPVRFWRVLPFGPTIDTETRSEAWIADSGHPVVMVTGVSGYVSLHNVLPASELHPDAPQFQPLQV